MSFSRLTIFFISRVRKECVGCHLGALLRSDYGVACGLSSVALFAAIYRASGDQPNSTHPDDRLHRRRVYTFT